MTGPQRSEVPLAVYSFFQRQIISSGHCASAPRARVWKASRVKDKVEGQQHNTRRITLDKQEARALRTLNNLAACIEVLAQSTEDLSDL